MELVWKGTREGLSPGEEEQLQTLMTPHHRLAHRLHGEDLLRAGRILVGTWALGDALQQAMQEA